LNLTANTLNYFYLIFQDDIRDSLRFDSLHITQTNI